MTARVERSDKPTTGSSARVPPGEGQMDTFGDRLRSARIDAGLSVRALARGAEVSPSFVSQIENGKSQPSVATLYGFARALDISVEELFDTEPLDTGDGSLGRTDPVDTWLPNEFSSRISVIHPAHRSRIEISEGITWERLAATPERGMAFLRIAYEPGAGLDLVSHDGYEYGYVLQGILEVTVGAEVFRLEEGDAIGFDSTIPHMLRNVGDTAMQGVWFIHKNTRGTHR